jgi:hypothetical protein
MTWTGDRIHPKLYRLPRIKCSVAFERTTPHLPGGVFYLP